MLTEINIHYNSSVIGKINKITEKFKFYNKIVIEVSLDSFTFGISNQIIDKTVYDSEPSLQMESLAS